MTSTFDSQNWQNAFQNAHEIISTFQPDGVWASQSDAVNTYNTVKKALEKDVQTFQKDTEFITAVTPISDEAATQKTVALIKEWCQSGVAPSLLAMNIVAMSLLNQNMSEDLKQCIVIGSILAEIPNENTYHSVIHYKKVVLQMMRLIHVHNDIYHGTSYECDAEDIVFLHLAATIHDLGHDGLGNTMQGVYKQARLERQSYSIILKYFSAVEVQDKEKYQAVLMRLRTVLLCTDASPAGSPSSFASQMKTAYKHHFLNTVQGFQSLNLDPEIKMLERDTKLTSLAMLLHEADIATSAGLTYEVTAFETTLFYTELGEPCAKPSHVIDFMNTIYTRQTLSAAAQTLYSANMARIIALANQDIQNGDKPFPSIEDSAFLNG